MDKLPTNGTGRQCHDNAHAVGRPKDVGSHLQFPLDKAEAQRFLTLLDAEAEKFLFAAGDDDKERRKALIAEAKTANSAPPALWQHRLGTVAQAAGWIEQRQQNGWGAFVCVQEMKGDRALKDKVTFIRAIFAEMDIAEPWAPWPIDPSHVVETSPGRNHMYWLTDAKAPINVADFQGMMARLAETHGSDPNAKDLARRLRLPGTWNLKPGREPHLVRIIGGTGARYSRDELLSAFPPQLRPDPQPLRRLPPPYGRAPTDLERFHEPLAAISPDDYGDWISVGMALHAETGGGEDGLALWDRWSAGSDKFAPGVCAEKWKTFSNGNGISGGTIVHMAKERGWIPRRRSHDCPFENGRGNDDAPRSMEREESKPELDLSNALEFDHEITIDTHVDALVKGLLHRGDVAAMYGPSGVAKTFVALDLAYHIALGKSYQGRRVRQAPVLYVGLEGARGLRHRMVACREQLGSASMLARLKIDTPLNKGGGESGQKAIIVHAKRLSETAGQQIGLIIIDTLARAIAPDDENTAQDMSAFVSRCCTIVRETGAAVLVVHHPGKDEARGMRGSSSLFAACDLVIKVTVERGIRHVTAEKIKEGSTGHLFDFRLKPVVLGVDDDDDEITTCIVETVSGGVKQPARPPPDSQAGIALAELEDLVIARKGEVARNHARAPNGAFLVDKSHWRVACRARHLTSEGDAENEKKAFSRAFQRLGKDSLIGQYGSHVWLLTKRSDDPRSMSPHNG